jgi:Response regulator containing CheY-like receiver domain and AraC-type DNA-binding domain
MCLYGIEKILEIVGIENSKYFFVIYKKHYGITPSAYRLKHRRIGTT